MAGIGMVWLAMMIDRAPGSMLGTVDGSTEPHTRHNRAGEPHQPSRTSTNAFGRRMSRPRHGIARRRWVAGRSHNGVPETRTASSQTPTIAAIREWEEPAICRRSLTMLMKRRSHYPRACNKVARSQMNSGDAIQGTRSRRGNETVSSNATRPGLDVKTSHPVAERRLLDVVGHEQH